HDLQAIEFLAATIGALAEFDVTPGSVGNSRGLANLVGTHGHETVVEHRLDLRLDNVVELGALGGEKLDAVVVMRVVRGTDDNAGGSAEGARQVGHGGCRHGAEHVDVHAGGSQARLKRGLE